MFKQIFYRLVELKPAIKISEVTDIDLGPAGVIQVGVGKEQEARVVSIDWEDTFLIEFTGKFSSDALQIFTGDILELPEAMGQAPAGLYIVSYTPGCFMAFHVHEPVSVPLFDENVISKMSYKGNQWQNPEVVVDYLKQFDDVELKAENLPNETA